MIKSIKFSLYFLAFVMFASSCADEIDEPPGPEVNVNATVKMLKELQTLPGVAVEITEDWDIEATVTADDRSGNFFRKIIIADETAAIDLILDNVELYTLFPRGSKIFVKCKGLWIGDFNGQVNLSANANGDGLPDALFESTVFAGDEVTEPVPTIKTIDELGPDDLSGLFTFEEVQFTSGSANRMYADPFNEDFPQSINHTLEDCNGNDIIVRTSGFADFAAALTPGGKGSLTGIYGVFGSDRQIFIRDLNDVEMEDERCGLGGPGLTQFSEDFQGFENNEDIFSNGWQNFAVQGTRLWRAREFNGNLYAQATAFNDEAANMEAWLISPGLDMDQVSNFSFETAKAFFTHDALTVWITTEFDGNPATTNWTQMNVTVAEDSDSDHAFIPSGNIDISGYSGKGYIGFKYEGSGPDGLTGTFRIDNVTID